MVRIQQVQSIPKLHHFRNRARPKESHKSQCRDEMIAKLFLTSFSICEPFLSWWDKWDYERCRFVATDESFLSSTPVELKLNSKSKPKWCFHMSKILKSTFSHLGNPTESRTIQYCQYCYPDLSSACHTLDVLHKGGSNECPDLVSWYTNYQNSQPINCM